MKKYIFLFTVFVTTLQGGEMSSLPWFEEYQKGYADRLAKNEKRDLSDFVDSYKADKNMPLNKFYFFDTVDQDRFTREPFKLDLQWFDDLVKKITPCSGGCVLLGSGVEVAVPTLLTLIQLMNDLTMFDQYYLRYHNQLNFSSRTVDFDDTHGQDFVRNLYYLLKTCKDNRIITQEAVYYFLKEYDVYINYGPDSIPYRSSELVRNVLRYIFLDKFIPYSGFSRPSAKLLEDISKGKLFSTEKPVLGFLSSRFNDLKYYILSLLFPPSIPS